MTWILTPLIETSSVIWTVSICDAFWVCFWHNWCFLWSAWDKWVAHPSWRTLTFGIVILNCAGGWRGTGVIIKTWVGTFVADTGSILSTVLIDSALHSYTVNIRITLQARRTSAGWLMVGGVAFSIGGTWIISNTGIKTISVSTNFCDGTFWVWGTSNWTNNNILCATRQNYSVRLWSIYNGDKYFFLKMAE